jgi:hypothetical protein
MSNFFEILSSITFNINEFSYSQIVYMNWDIRLKALILISRPTASTKQPQTALLTSSPRVNIVRSKTNGLP